MISLGICCSDPQSPEHEGYRVASVKGTVGGRELRQLLFFSIIYNGLKSENLAAPLPSLLLPRCHRTLLHQSSSGPSRPTASYLPDQTAEKEAAVVYSLPGWGRLGWALTQSVKLRKMPKSPGKQLGGFRPSAKVHSNLGSTVLLLQPMK